MLSRLAYIASFALVTLTGVGAATAADFTPPPPPQPCCDNWYIRGQIGVGINNKNDVEISPAIPDGYIASNSIGDATFYGAGVGYYFNNWLRFDGTAEYRGKTSITALATEQPGGAGPVAVDQYQGNLSSLVFLANAYVDLGTWNCITPFIGAGIGGAYNMVSDFTDVTPNVFAFGARGSSFGLGRGTNKWDLAWALYAGVSYAVTKNFNVDLSYRYLDYGSAAETVDCNGGTGCNDFAFKKLTSNDFMVSLRWTCCELETARYEYGPPPAEQPPAYQPPPPAQPPLRSRG